MAERNAVSRGQVGSGVKCELAGLAAVQLASGIAAGEFSSAEVVEAHIERIEAVNPKLNALVAERFDDARAEAERADRRLAVGEQMGPLYGVPITVKESIGLAGLPTTGGLPSRAGQRAASDDRFVAKLREAGAIVLGKTNAAQIMLFVETDNPLYGRTNNPWDPDRSPGGSSGGEGAIIAAGGSPLGVGTDLGGSCRVPAAVCGIVAFKPTAGRIPDDGRVSISVGERAITSQLGILAREVDDVGVALEVMHRARDPHVDPPAALGKPSSVDVARLRVAFFTEDGIFPPVPSVKRAVENSAAALGHIGASVARWSPPEVAHACDLFFGLLSADGARHLKRLLGGDKRDPRVAKIVAVASSPRPLLEAVRALLRLSGRGKLVDQVLRNYGHSDTAHYWSLVEEQMAYRARFRDALDSAEGGPFDVILCPAFPLPAMRHGATDEVVLAGAYSCLYNVLGYPAGVVPITRVRAGEELAAPTSRDKMDVAAYQTSAGSVGLPIGVQIVARPWHDHVALATMTAVQGWAKTQYDYPAHPE